MALLLGAPTTLTTGGCKSDDAPATRVDSDPRRNLYGRARKPERAADTPLKTPELDVPEGTDGPALADGEVDAIMQNFEGQRDQLADIQLAALLRPCANREPASARCDGELALLLLPVKKRRATALYYAQRAAAADDPKANAELYARLGEAIRPFGLYDESARAYAMAYAREDKAEYHVGRSVALQAKRGGSDLEAAEELAKARASRDEWAWMRDEAVLRARVPAQWERAHELLLEVAAKAPDEAQRERFEQRAAQLEGQIAALRASERDGASKPKSARPGKAAAKSNEGASDPNRG